jgi:hypothetical protein
MVNLPGILAPTAVPPFVTFNAPAPDNALHGSSSLLTHQSVGLSSILCRGGPPSAGFAYCAPAPPAPLVVLCLPKDLALQTHNFPCPPWHDPDILDEPLSLMGSTPYRAGGSPPSLHGGQFHPRGFCCRFPGGSYHQSCPLSLPSSGSMANQWCSYDFPGGIPLAVPSFIDNFDPHPPCPSHGGSPHAPASVALVRASVASPLRPLAHEDLSSLSVSDLMMSFWPPIFPFILCLKTCSLGIRDVWFFPAMITFGHLDGGCLVCL